MCLSSLEGMFSRLFCSFITFILGELQNEARCHDMLDRLGSLDFDYEVALQHARKTEISRYKITVQLSLDMRRA